MEFQPKLGEIVGVPLGPNGDVQVGSQTIIHATVVAVEHEDDGLDICVGFKGADKGIPVDAVAFDKFDPICWRNSLVASNILDFDSYLWIYHDELERVFVSNTSVQMHTPTGVSCSKCGEGNPWGEPNQPDGSYKCRGCRR